MKCILRDYGLNMSPRDKVMARAKAADMVRARGTDKAPLPPRDVQVQPAPRGLFLSWKLPGGYTDDITGWRIYKDTETSLYMALADAGARQCFIEATAAATSPVTNVFVSSVNAYGKESQKIQAQGGASAESGAPTMPSSPPEYGSVDSGGALPRGGTGRYSVY